MRYMKKTYKYKLHEYKKKAADLAVAVAHFENVHEEYMNNIDSLDKKYIKNLGEAHHILKNMCKVHSRALMAVYGISMNTISLIEKKKRDEIASCSIQE